MGTLASELGPHVDRTHVQPRVYVDANVPARLVAFMRQSLDWDAMFVMEHDDLRRAPDIVHYRRALEFGRTLFTLDRDFLDDKRFPPAESPGVVILSAPDEGALMRLLQPLDREVMRAPEAAPMPYRGRKIGLAPEVE